MLILVCQSFPSFFLLIFPETFSASFVVDAAFGLLGCYYSLKQDGLHPNLFRTHKVLIVTSSYAKNIFPENDRIPPDRVRGRLARPE
jgi:hypothetical protein